MLHLRNLLSRAYHVTLWRQKETKSWFVTKKKFTFRKPNNAFPSNFFSPNSVPTETLAQYLYPRCFPRFLASKSIFNRGFLPRIQLAPTSGKNPLCFTLSKNPPFACRFDLYTENYCPSS